MVLFSLIFKTFELSETLATSFPYPCLIRGLFKSKQTAGHAMHVLDIIIEDCRFDQAQSRYVGCVIFEQDSGQRSSFFCAVNPPHGFTEVTTREYEAPRIEAAMIDDAKRQAMRMPELRSGRGKITFAKKYPVELA